MKSALMNCIYLIVSFATMCMQEEIELQELNHHINWNDPAIFENPEKNLILLQHLEDNEIASTILYKNYATILTAFHPDTECAPIAHNNTPENIFSFQDFTISKDGKTIVAFDEKQRFHLIEVATQKPIAHFDMPSFFLPSSTVDHMAYGENKILIGTNKGEVCVFNTKKENLEEETFSHFFVPHQADTLGGLDILTHDTYALSYALTIAKIWNTTNGNKHALFTHPSTVLAFLCNQQQTTAYSLCADERIYIWNIAQQECINTIEGQQSFKSIGLYNNDTSLLAYGNETIFSWQLDDYSLRNIDEYPLLNLDASFPKKPGPLLISENNELLLRFLNNTELLLHIDGNSLHIRKLSSNHKKRMLNNTGEYLILLNQKGQLGICHRTEEINLQATLASISNAKQAFFLAAWSHYKNKKQPFDITSYDDLILALPEIIQKKISGQLTAEGIIRKKGHKNERCTMA